jgi:hypothetical protein
MMTPALAAARYVCGHARDLDDARLLLDALGLIDGGRLHMPDPGVLDVGNMQLRRIGAGDYRRYSS